MMMMMMMMMMMIVFDYLDYLQLINQRCELGSEVFASYQMP